MDCMPNLSTLTPENFELVLSQVASGDDSLRLRLYREYAFSKLYSFLRWGRMEDLEEAIQKSRQAVEVTPEDHPDLAATLDSLGSILISRYEHTRNIGDLEEAIEIARQAVKATPRNNLDRAMILKNLGGKLETRYERIGNREDLEEAIQTARRAVEAMPEDHPAFTEILSSLGSKLGSRYERTGDREDLEEAIQIARRAVEATPEDDPDLARWLNNLGSMLMRGKREDFEEAIQKSRQAVEVTPKDHPDLVVILSNLGSMLRTRYERIGNREDLEEAIQIAKRAVEATPEDHPNLAAILNNLGNELEIRYNRTGNREDLEEAIQKARQAVEATPEDHPDLARWLSSLASKLANRYERIGNIKDLEEAIQIARRAVEAMPEDHPNLAMILSNLGNKLEARYEHTGNREDLEEAIQKARRAVEATPEDHPDFTGFLSSLGSKLRNRCECTGNIKDLEEAIQIARRAVETIPEDHPDLAGRLNSLAAKLGSRYERTRNREDLEEAIQIVRRAVEATPEDHPDLAGRLNSLVGNLGSRYERTGNREDLEEAIQIARQVVETMPEDHPDFTGFLSNLGNELESRYKRTGNREDLEEAIQIARRAVEAMPEDHPNLAATLNNNLGNKLASRHEHTGNIEDLEEAIQIARQVVKATPEDHPDLARWLNSLGIKLEHRYEHTGKTEDLKMAIKLFQNAWKCENAIPFARILGSTQAIRLLQSQQNFESAYDLSVEAIRLLPLVHNRSLDHQDQQFVISYFSGLATTACSLALQTRKGPETALEILEQGRGAILSLLMDDRSDTSELKSVDPLLCEQYEILRSEVNKPVKDIVDNGRRKTTSINRTETIAKLEKCIQEIQLLPGFSHFHKALNSKQMQSCASKGSIVIINITDYRCDALLVEQHQIRSLALPHLHIEDIKKKAQSDDLGNPRNLEWLWNVVTNPILDALGLIKPPSDDSWPHIWWIPTGPLTKFPLHAAGLHGKNSTQTVLDRVMSSYSLSIKAIKHGRSIPEDTQPAYLQALLVAMNDTPKHGVLPFANEEVEIVHGLCESMALHPIEPGLHKRDIISHLPNCRIFHFAGHGYTDNSDPSQSNLLLMDWESDRLTVANLLEMNLRERSPLLAYLSACGTGQVNAARLIDENIHLISACQLAGFRHVIGTLWEVNDELCKDMAELTYKGIRNGGMTDESVCCGLHHASRELRAKTMGMHDKRNSRSWRDADLIDEEVETGLTHWVPYVHFGV